MSILSSTNTGISSVKINPDILISEGWRVLNHDEIVQLSSAPQYGFTSPSNGYKFAAFGSIGYDQTEKAWFCLAREHRLYIANVQELKLVKKYLTIVSSTRELDRQDEIDEIVAYFNSIEHRNLLLSMN